MKCLGKDRNLQCCRNRCIGDTQFCKFHQYMITYNDEQLNALKICSGCKKAFYLPDRKTCHTCGKRTKIAGEQNVTTVIQCAVEKCNFKKSENNKYCLKHQIHVWVDNVKEQNQVPCTQYIRGCRNILSTDCAFKRCDECRQKERNGDNKKRQQARTNNDENSDLKTCTTCGKTQSKASFLGQRSTETKTCQTCRDRNKVQDKKRDKIHRLEQGRIYDSREKRKLQKKEWKQNNLEKVVRVWKMYRERQQKYNRDKYLQRNAENMKTWRQKNPEKCKIIKENSYKNKNTQYSIYKRSAHHRNIYLDLTYDHFANIVVKPCHYCGCTNKRRGFNGIDRVNNNEGYVKDNCVSCCSMCNYMKGKLNRDTFLKKIEHIMVHIEKIGGNTHDELFNNYCHTPYDQYVKRAYRKKLQFEISSEEFNEIVKNPCYICGKKSTHNHSNGIDRYDNNLGYTSTNTRPCCADCNYMKMYFCPEIFFNKISSIYNTCILYSEK